MLAAPTRHRGTIEPLHGAALRAPDQPPHAARPDAREGLHFPLPTEDEAPLPGHMPAVAIAALWRPDIDELGDADDLAGPFLRRLLCFALVEVRQAIAFELGNSLGELISPPVLTASEREQAAP